MRVLVFGQGGREHSLVRAMHRSGHELICCPGSPAIGLFAKVVTAKLDQIDRLAEIAANEKPDLVVIGPELPLALGLADRLRALGLTVFGPSQKGARLEASKIFAKEFMQRAGVATSAACKVQSVEETLSASESFTPPYVLKADGLAAGKGVFICETKQELQHAAEQLFVRQILGNAGRSALLEQFQKGYELSVLILVHGETYTWCPVAQDHKRLLDGQKGPNTGGMGTIAPLALDSQLREQIESRILKPTMRGLLDQQLDFRGVLFIGLMVNDQGPSALEYNVRFGDPETQVIVPLLDGDWAEVLTSVGQGHEPKVKWKDGFAACIVISALGYPDAPQLDVPIQGDLLFDDGESYVLHAGTQRNVRGDWSTAGGRVLNAVSFAPSPRQALERCYSLTDRVQFKGMHYRRDIGREFLDLTERP